MSRLLLLRHGESVWNLENRFTGWSDVDLSMQGVIAAQQAGMLLKKDEFRFDICYTSFLKRAIKTLWIVLETMDIMWVPVHKTWLLNERHYGALQGRSKAEVAQEVGEDRVSAWRRSFDARPPQLDPADARHPSHDPRYSSIDHSLLPATESLQDAAQRVISYWRNAICHELRKAKCALIVGHGNGLRTLVQHLNGISNAEVHRLEIPTGVPLVYELDENLERTIVYYDLATGIPRPVPGLR